MTYRMEKCRRVLAMLLCTVLLAGLMPVDALAEEGEACPHENTYTTEENVVYASCLENGSHDTVVYCADCVEELHREMVIDYAAGHMPGEAVMENEVPATCTMDGSHDEVIYCTVCGAELNRVTVTDYAAGHVSGQTVTENVVPTTDEADGSHDEVTYCAVCEAELNRMTVTDPRPEKTFTAEQKQEQIPLGEQNRAEVPELPEEMQADALVAPKLGATRDIEMGMRLDIIYEYSPHGRVGIVEPSQYGASVYYSSDELIEYSIMSGSAYTVCAFSWSRDN